MKKTFLTFFAFILIFSLFPAIIIPIADSYRLVNYFSAESQNNWNIKPLQEKKENGDTFIAYYGYAECPYCKKVSQKLALNEDVKKTIKQIESDLNIEKGLIQWFYRWDSFDKKKNLTKTNETVFERN